MQLLRPGVSQHLRACPSYVDRHAIPLRPHARIMQQPHVCRATQKPLSSGDDEVDDIRKQLEAYLPQAGNDTPEAPPQRDSISDSSRGSDGEGGSTSVPFRSESPNGDSVYSTRPIPPSLLSSSTQEASTDVPAPSVPPSNSLSEPSQPTDPASASMHLDQPDTRSTGMDYANEFSKIAAARQLKQSGKDRQDTPLTSNDILSILASEIRSPGGSSSDGVGSGTDDDFFLNLPTAFNTSDDEASNSVQDTLAEVMSMEVRKQQFKEGFLTELEGKKDNLRSIGEQIKDELAARLEIDKMRAELTSSVAMSDTMDKFDALEAEIRAIQDQLKADEADLQAFEERNAEERSKALFFKGLYVAPKKKKPESTSSSPNSNQEASGVVGNDAKAALSELTDKLAAPQPTDSLRLFVFASLAAGCCAVVAADLATGDPSMGSDVLFGGLAALLVLTAVQEQKKATKRRPDTSGGANFYDGRDKGNRRR